MRNLTIPENVIKTISGRAVPLPEANQDTDLLIPAKWLKAITFKGIEEGFYEGVRYDDAGNLNPDHPLNRPEYKGVNIIIAGANYGCGSSREHAPQAAKRFGITAIIAESYAKIFEGNTSSLGVVGICVAPEQVTELSDIAKEHPDAEFNIDLTRKVIVYKTDETAGQTAFNMPEGRRQAFLRGLWDVLSVLQNYQERVDKRLDKLPYMKFDTLN